MADKEKKKVVANKETNISVSVNSKRILWALFILVIAILLVFTITVKNYPALSDRLNTVFIAAISGILALGGTLITQLWGRRKSNGPPPPPGPNGDTPPPPPPPGPNGDTPPPPPPPGPNGDTPPPPPPPPPGPNGDTPPPRTMRELTKENFNLF